MSKQELKELIDYLNKLTDSVPRGLSNLKDALTFTILDLTAYWRHDIRMKSLNKALAFAESIPRFTDLDSDECCGWMLHDEEHCKYWD